MKKHGLYIGKTANLVVSSSKRSAVGANQNKSAAVLCEDFILAEFKPS